MVNEDVDISTMNCYVEYTSKLEMATKLKKKLIAKETQDVGILKVNQFTFYINKYTNDPWSKEYLEILEKFFSKTRKSKNDDFIIPGTVELECLELPVHVWVEANLRGFIKFWEFGFPNLFKMKNICTSNPYITCVT